MSLRAAARIALAALAMLPVWLAANADHLPGVVILIGTAAAPLAAPAVPVALLRWLPPPVSAMMVVTRRRLAREGGSPIRLAYDWVPLERISLEMQRAAVAAEDAYFRDHSGFDWESIRDARAHNRTHEKKRGASTITQQVAKNLFLWPARSWLRKALEAWLTLTIEALWPKRRILEVYLNIAQFGPDVFGVEAAARRYFEKHAADLTGVESALLAASLPNPVKYPVDRPSHQMRFRQSWILTAMQQLPDWYLERL